MSDPAAWVQAGCEVGLLVVAGIALLRDGFQARRARAETAQAEWKVEQLRQDVVDLLAGAKAEQEEIAEQVAKVKTPKQAAALAGDIRKAGVDKMNLYGAGWPDAFVRPRTVRLRARADGKGMELVPTDPDYPASVYRRKTERQFRDNLAFYTRGVKGEPADAPERPPSEDPEL